MAYLTQGDIESSAGGWGYQDFKYGGQKMTSAQWTSFCADLINSVTAAINSYCKVTSFEQTTYTEYHNGRGASAELGEYLPRDRTFLMREQPVMSVTSVSENTASETSAPSWTTRIQRAAGIAANSADYAVLQRGTMTYIWFFQNVPAFGSNNVQITYVAGYAAASAELDAIRMIAQQIVSNYLAKYRALQEASAARTIGTKESADMFKVQVPDVMTPDVRSQLDSFKRMRCMGSAWR
ncbi:MAG: hypothetical protein PHD55_04755 [Methanoregula sp.]|jgi:hypothetical protein|nr:hypothetical protein [Methanoregula sp.]